MSTGVGRRMAAGAGTPSTVLDQPAMSTTTPAGVKARDTTDDESESDRGTATAPGPFDEEIAELAPFASRGYTGDV
ncbi:hypothetical protein [Halorarum salinum]|uniref:Uncharacterized protein n=1 Tax=Halorarum salinum TaxID=2743089 RepID=A0A7D5QC40_9EURY|nr:hypothetical protein [Halobaculum salinum]QLG63058.1 hypothetical protein HUG12_15485 [Halobaculum salinum]